MLISPLRMSSERGQNDLNDKVTLLAILISFPFPEIMLGLFEGGHNYEVAVLWR